MREFILKASKAFTKPFRLDDLPGAGRIDLVCRCVTSAIWLSHALRKDVVFHAVLEGPDRPPKLISFYSNDLKAVSPDERNVASHINHALKLGYNLKLNEEVEVSPGIKIAKKSFEEFVKEKSRTTQLFYLHPKGEDIRKVKFDKDVCFILGDHLGLPKATEKLLKKLNIKRVSLGKTEYLASHCITICNYEIDKFFFKRK
jgi:tRNA (pseudouridine54-N1)-methyltransferase